ncbi:helix-turn-helix domain-containing protein [Rossellomorea vietnamensis]|uniref:HTH cro/C1-type domain-containing protein n=1 Tax=Rossellomorea vietnamensis TaxID=218284 RepID=A0A0P6WI52_9BACI|nr:helix-turn-helix transcriptional regulator [Rossellomorea vietnamensis]KPL60279.1 hypothetical protein AM506_06590 [Rossellomorea vietnamensis]
MDKETVMFIRKENGLTQRAFAEVIRCSYSLIALVECGKRRVTSNLEHKIRTAFPDGQKRTKKRS